ncbi:hypothetical protein [Roseibium polysiphoniae]|uniref:Uncharacterized protein n=1 Tax=Roseibium polysiphoniae TaxID=2571221 RepID=A0ABR9CCQ4_9HYPH|nr:hypothetical protein [Roseibium polysiphoniae]MBD8877668.1 hypothetical protein [Roseibium polysiphoniae]
MYNFDTDHDNIDPTERPDLIDNRCQSCKKAGTPYVATYNRMTIGVCECVRDKLGTEWYLEHCRNEEREHRRLVEWEDSD